MASSLKQNWSQLNNKKNSCTVLRKMSKILKERKLKKCCLWKMLFGVSFYTFKKHIQKASLILLRWAKILVSVPVELLPLKFEKLSGKMIVYLIKVLRKVVHIKKHWWVKP